MIQVFGEVQGGGEGNEGRAERGEDVIIVITKRVDFPVIEVRSKSGVINDTTTAGKVPTEVSSGDFSE